MENNINICNPQVDSLLELIGNFEYNANVVQSILDSARKGIISDIFPVYITRLFNHNIILDSENLTSKNVLLNDDWLLTASKSASIKGIKTCKLLISSILLPQVFKNGHVEQRHIDIGHEFSSEKDLIASGYVMIDSFHKLGFLIIAKNYIDKIINSKKDTNNTKILNEAKKQQKIIQNYLFTLIHNMSSVYAKIHQAIVYNKNFNRQFIYIGNDIFDQFIFNGKFVSDIVSGDCSLNKFKQFDFINIEGPGFCDNFLDTLTKFDMPIKEQNIDLLMRLSMFVISVSKLLTQDECLRKIISTHIKENNLCVAEDIFWHDFCYFVIGKNEERNKKLYKIKKLVNSTNNIQKIIGYLEQTELYFLEVRLNARIKKDIADSDFICLNRIFSDSLNEYKLLEFHKNTSFLSDITQDFESNKKTINKYKEFESNLISGINIFLDWLYILKASLRQYNANAMELTKNYQGDVIQFNNYSNIVIGNLITVFLDNYILLQDISIIRSLLKKILDSYFFYSNIYLSWFIFDTTYNFIMFIEKTKFLKIKDNSLLDFEIVISDIEDSYKQNTFIITRLITKIYLLINVLNRLNYLKKIMLFSLIVIFTLLLSISFIYFYFIK